MRVLICGDLKKEIKKTKKTIKKYDPKIKTDVANTIDAMLSELSNSKHIAIFLVLSFKESKKNKNICNGLQVVPEILTIQPNLPLIFVLATPDYDIVRKIVQIESNTIIDVILKYDEPSSYTHALEKAMKIDNKKISEGEKIFDKTLNEYQEGKYFEAFTSLVNAIDNGYSSEETLSLFLNIVKNISKNEDNAFTFFYKKIDEIKEILKRTPSKEIKWALAIAYENMRELKKSTKFFEEVKKDKSMSNDLIIEVDKKLKKLYYKLGEIREEKNMRKDMLKIYKKRENILESINLLKKEIRRFPSDPNLLLDLIILEKKQEQWVDIANYTKLFLERLVDKIFDPELTIEIFKGLIDHIDLNHKKLNNLYIDYDFYKKIIEFCIASEQIDLAYELSSKHFDELLKNDIDLLKTIIEDLEIENSHDKAKELITRSFDLKNDSFYSDWIEILYRSKKYKDIIKEYENLKNMNFMNKMKPDKIYYRFHEITPYAANALIEDTFFNGVELVNEIIPFLLDQQNEQKVYDLIYNFLTQSFLTNNVENIGIFMNVFWDLSLFWTQSQKNKIENAYAKYLEQKAEKDIRTISKHIRISLKIPKEKIKQSDHHKKQSVINFQIKCASSIYVDEVAIRGYKNGTLRQFHRVIPSSDKNKNIELEYYFCDGQYMHRVILQTTTNDENFVKKIRKEVHEKTKIFDEEITK